jgi:hypothetical protein
VLARQRPSGGAATLRGRFVGVLALMAVAVFLLGLNHVRLYMHENSTWLTAHGLLLGPPVLAGSPGEDYAVTTDQVIDEFLIDRGPATICRWVDAYAEAVPSLARVRAIARAKRWRPGTRVRLKINPTNVSRCRPAYGWAEFVRLDLTGYVFLVLLFGVGALYVHLEPRSR